MSNSVDYSPIFNSDDFKVKFQGSNTYGSAHGKYRGIDITNENGQPLTFKFSNCKVIDVFRQKKTPKPDEMERARLWLRITEEDDIKMYNKLKMQIIKKAIENRLEWFNDFEANEDQIESLIKENFKDLLKYDDKYDQYSAYFDVSYAYYKYGNAVFKDYVSGEDEHTNTTYTFLNGKLEKGSVLDIAFCVRSLNIDLSNNEYRVRGATERIHYIGHDSKFTETKPLPGVLPGDYDSNQLNLGKRQSHEQAGGKYCEVYYGESDGEKQFKFKGTLKNVKGRIVKITDKENPNKITYKLILDLDRKEDYEMYQNMSDDIFQKLLKDSKTYYGSKKSETKLKGDYQAFGGYSEDDQKLIKAGEEPKNGRQLWIKLFCDEKGTDGFGKALKNTAKDIYESNPKMQGSRTDLQKGKKYERGKVIMSHFTKYWSHYNKYIADQLDNIYHYIKNDSPDLFFTKMLFSHRWRPIILINFMKNGYYDMDKNNDDIIITKLYNEGKMSPNEVKKTLMMLFPTMKLDEIDLLSKLITKNEIKKLLRDTGASE